MFRDKTSTIHRFIVAVIIIHVYNAMSDASQTNVQNPKADGDSSKTNASNSNEKIPNLISREEWGARKPRLFYERLKLDHPVPYVLISYFTPDSTDDKMTLRSIQYKHMNAGLIDIQSNFLISRDGKIYEGRGWELRPARSEELPSYAGKYIEISYIGDFNQEDVKHPIFRATWEVMDFGRKHGYIDENFQMLSDKHTKQ